MLNYVIDKFKIMIVLYIMIFECTLIRAQSGSIDATFNPGHGANDLILTTDIQADGKIIIGGDFTNYWGANRNRIARLNTNGTLDNDFDTGTGANDEVVTTTIQPDGKIIIGGGFTSFDGAICNRLARLNSDGSLDVDFNTVEGANDYVFTTALQPDGKIILGGFFTSYNGEPFNRITRLNSDGSLDNDFNPGLGANSLVSTSVLQPNGKIIIGGDFTTYDGTSRPCIARLNPDGSLDTDFNPGLGANGRIWSMSLQPDGKIIIGGFFTSYDGTSRNRIARLNSDGSLDTDFNPGTGAFNTIRTTTLLPNGKIIVGGLFTNYNGTLRNRVARINTNGSLDTDFNPGAGANNWVTTSSLQSDGKLIIGGRFTSYDEATRNRIARIHAIEIYEWTGTQNTDWNNTDNWDNGVPTESADVVIPTGLTNYPEVTNLTFSGEITLEKGASLTVTGVLTNNGELTIEHGASLVQTEGSTLAGTGLYHQQIVVNGTGASPGNRQILFGPAIPNATTESINAAGSNRFWFFNETAHQWQEVTDNSTNFNGRAVLGRTDGVETYTFTSNQINNGDIEMAGLTRTGTTNNNRGYHTIANPYPSYIDWHGVERENAARTYMIRTFNAGTNQVVRDFYSANSQIGTNNSDQPLGEEISRYIAPGQGFEIRVIGEGNTGKLDFKNEIRSHRNPSSQVTLSNTALARIRLFEESNVFDETVIFVNEEASNDLDDRDTEKSIFNNPSQFYSLESGKRLVMNGFNNPEEKGFVPLGFRATATGNFQIGLGNVSMQEPLILRDKESNTFHDLREGNYAFYSAEGENNERFELHFASLLNVKDNISTDKAITIFANDGQININIDDNINMENASIAVYDSQGALVSQINTKEHTSQLSTNLPKGMYVVKVQTNNGYFETRRVVL